MINKSIVVFDASNLRTSAWKLVGLLPGTRTLVRFPDQRRTASETLSTFRGDLRLTCNGPYEFLMIVAHGGVTKEHFSTFQTEHFGKLKQRDEPPDDFLADKRCRSFVGVNLDTGSRCALLDAEGVGGVLPSFPSQLCFNLSCWGGWEPSLALSFLNRGCRFYIGFRVSADGNAQNPAEFLRAWKDEMWNPEAIPSVFQKWATQCAWHAYPILYERVYDGYTVARLVDVYLANPGTRTKFNREKRISTADEVLLRKVFLGHGIEIASVESPT